MRLAKALDLPIEPYPVTVPKMDKKQEKSKSTKPPSYYQATSLDFFIKIRRVSEKCLVLLTSGLFTGAQFVARGGSSCTLTKIGYKLAHMSIVPT